MQLEDSEIADRGLNGAKLSLISRTRTRRAVVHDVGYPNSG